MEKAKLARPGWLTDPKERPKQVLFLAESGVSRTVMRALTGWSNNQMAGFSTRAGVVFNKYQVASHADMRKALCAVGFDEQDVDAAIANVPLVADSRHAVAQSEPAKKDRKPARTRKKSSEAPEKSAAAPEAQLDGPEKIVPPTAGEVSDDWRRQISAAARASGVEQGERVPAATPTPLASSPPLDPATDTDGCQWPLATGGSIKEPKVCGKPAVDGLCEKHRDEIRGRKRILR